jgi:two-component SAPR family response regulator
LVWLDPELVDSRSAAFARVVARLDNPPTPAQVAEVSATYQGRFALDFAYEEWAAAHRNMQHAAFLQVIEDGLRLDAYSGNFQRGIDIARAAIAIDPDAEQVEQSLLRLYKLAGLHAAASEQYAHYAAHLKAELDADAPTLESI